MSAGEECAHSWQQKETDVELHSIFCLTCTQLMPDDSLFTEVDDNHIP